MKSSNAKTLETELNEISALRIRDLRKRWLNLFHSEPPSAFGPDLLRRAIAHRLQENAFGGLTTTTARYLNQLLAQSAKGNGKITVPRHVKPGAILVRGWKGQTHRVTVLDSGFAFEGKTYASLSEVARLITGARWNGPRFFGLRNSQEVGT